jgi:hypothetical protein
VVIRNEKMLEVSKQAAQEFRDAINKLEDDKTWEPHPLLKTAVLDGMRSQLESLDEEIAEYERGQK